MKKYKYSCKYRTLYIRLFVEDGKTLYDCIFVCNNIDVGSLQIYDKLYFSRRFVVCFPICYSFTDTKCEEAVRSRMMDLMQINPYISLSELIKITGHSKPSVIRHYMTLKRKLSRDRQDTTYKYDIR
jgi:hypothetical protein